MAVQIKGVSKGSVADVYGIKPDDTLVKINGEEINDMLDLQFYQTGTDLEIPNALVCSEDCQGLCQFCGRPKAENCGCEDKQIDPRLLVLKQLLQDDDN